MTKTNQLQSECNLGCHWSRWAWSPHAPARASRRSLSPSRRFTSTWIPSRSRPPPTPTASISMLTMHPSCSNTRCGPVRKALRRCDQSLRQAAQEFPRIAYARPALYNLGLAQIDKKDWPAAIDSFKTLVEKYPPQGRQGFVVSAGCMLRRAGQLASFGRGLCARSRSRRSDADDRIEAIARRGFAQFNLNDLDTAEKTFRAAMTYKQKIENEERLSTDFYLAFSQYHLGQIFHLRFRKAACACPRRSSTRIWRRKRTCCSPPSAPTSIPSSLAIRPGLRRRISGWLAVRRALQRVHERSHTARARCRGSHGLPGGATQEDPHPSREVAALAARESPHDRTPRRQHRVGREEQAGLCQAAQTAGSETTGRERGRPQDSAFIARPWSIRPCRLPYRRLPFEAESRQKSRPPSDDDASEAARSVARVTLCDVVCRQFKGFRPGFCLTGLPSRHIRSRLCVRRRQLHPQGETN